MTKISSLLILLSFSLSCLGDELKKHPRVAELETRMSQEAGAYLKGRFPEQPFTVLVGIDPFRRDLVQSTAGDEDLPYLTLENQQVTDEWDNPQISLTELMARIRKASVIVSVSKNVNDDDIAEIKNSVFSLLHLTLARDEVIVERKNWSSQQVSFGHLGIIAGFVLFSLIGLLLVNRNAAKKLAQALTALGSKTEGRNASSDQSSSGNQASLVFPNPAQATAGTNSGSTGSRSLVDPLEIKNWVKRGVDQLKLQNPFPTLEQMMTLDQYGQKSPSGLGALLLEFEPSLRERLFSLSYRASWLDALSRPGLLDMKSFEILEELQRAGLTEHSASYEDLLLYVWRLETKERENEFFKQIDPEDAFFILNELPKTLSIRVARTVFPGTWGRLLEEKPEERELNKEKVKKLKDLALKIRPLNPLNDLKIYRKQKELLNYLQGVDPREEREIYGASPPESMILKLRRPFFAIFDQDPNDIKSLVKRVPFDWWSVALFNVNRAEIKPVLAAFSEKQLVLHSQRMRQMDMNPPTLDLIASIRSQIANMNEAMNTEAVQIDKSKSTERASSDIKKIA